MASNESSQAKRREVLNQVSAPGGVHHPLLGKAEVYYKWWDPLVPALAGVGVRIIEHYYNESLTGIVTATEVTLAGPGITLRVADRFTVDEDGKIREQENQFDATPLSGGS